MENDIKKILAKLEEHDTRFDAIDNRFVAIDKRFDAIDSRLVTVDARLNAIETSMATKDDIASIRKEMYRGFGDLDTSINKIIALFADRFNQLDISVSNWSQQVDELYDRIKVLEGTVKETQKQLQTLAVA